MLPLIRATVLAAAMLAPLPGATTSPPSEAPLSATAEKSLRPGDEFRECPVCPHMIVVPAGRFTMGSPDDEPGRDSDEGPPQQIIIPAPFAVGRFEVTFAEWDACLAEGGCGDHRPGDLGWGRGRQPLIVVSWEDARAYVAWLSAKTGGRYRLLSEAEWEYAARAGTATAFWWGSSIASHDANYDGTQPFPGSPGGEFRQRTVPVDAFRPNPFGLYNVHGNVWEWVEDCWHRRYADMPTEVRQAGAPWVGEGCNERVFRGGSWADGPQVLRAANRGRYEAAIRNANGGFRVARSLAR